MSLGAGSLGRAGEQGHAPSFFSRVDVVSVDYSLAGRLADPTAATVPFQPSYEDRPGAPDRVFAAVDAEAYERLVAAWSEALAGGERRARTSFTFTCGARKFEPSVNRSIQATPLRAPCTRLPRLNLRRLGGLGRRRHAQGFIHRRDEPHLCSGPCIHAKRPGTIQNELRPSSGCSERSARRCDRGRGSHCQLHGHALPRLALTLDEAAASLGTSRDYLDEHIRPSLHVARLGRRVLVPVRELERWLDLNASRALGDQR